MQPIEAFNRYFDDLVCEAVVASMRLLPPGDGTMITSQVNRIVEEIPHSVSVGLGITTTCIYPLVRAALRRLVARGVLRHVERTYYGSKEKNWYPVPVFEGLAKAADG